MSGRNGVASRLGRVEALIGAPGEPTRDVRAELDRMLAVAVTFAPGHEAALRASLHGAVEKYGLDRLGRMEFEEIKDVMRSFLAAAIALVPREARDRFVDAIRDLDEESS